MARITGVQQDAHYSLLVLAEAFILNFWCVINYVAGYMIISSILPDQLGCLTLHLE